MRLLLSVFSFFLSLNLAAGVCTARVVEINEFLSKAGLSRCDSLPPDGTCIRITKGSEFLIDDISYFGESYGNLAASVVLRCGNSDVMPKTSRVVSVEKGVHSSLVIVSFKGADGCEYGRASLEVSHWPLEKAILVRLLSFKNTSGAACAFVKAELRSKAPFSGIELEEDRAEAGNRPQRAAWFSEDGRWIGGVSASAAFSGAVYAPGESVVSGLGSFVLVPDRRTTFIKPGETARWDDAWVLYRYACDGRYGWFDKTDRLPVYPKGDPLCIFASRRKVVTEIEGKKVISGDFEVKHSFLEPVVSPDVRSRIDESVVSSVRCIDLRKIGVNAGVVPVKEFLSYRADQDGEYWKDLPPMLFADGRMLRISRWPDKGWSMISEFLDSGRYTGRAFTDKVDEAAKTKKTLPAFRYSGNRPERWLKAPCVRLHGFWAYDWTDSIARVGKIDVKNKSITFSHNLHFGLLKKNPGAGRWRAVNLIEEITVPGEYAVDYENSKLYFLPPDGFSPSTRLTISAKTDPLLVLENLENVEFFGLVFQQTAGKGVVLKNCRNVVFRNCTFRNIRRKAVVIDNDCMDCVLTGCTFEDMETGVLDLCGGDRDQLKRGNNRVENCIFRRWSGMMASCSFAIFMSGCGNIIRNCTLSDAPTGAICSSAALCAVERNTFSNLSVSPDDTGGYYQGRNPFARGNELRHNIWKDIGSSRGQGSCAIYFDDGDCGNFVYGETFIRCGHPGRANFGTVFSHGGYANHVRNCVFIDCIRPLGSSPWNDGFWSDFIHSSVKSKKVDVFSPPFSLVWPSLKSICVDIEKEKRANYARNCVADGTPLIRTTVVPGEKKPGVIVGNWVTNDIQVVEKLVWAEADKEFRRRCELRASEGGF